MKNNTQNFEYNGIRFAVRANFIENKYGVFGDNMTHPSFIVTITTENDERARFNFYASYNDYMKGKKALDRDDMKNAVDCFLSDALAYDNSKDFLDFCDEFGYDVYEDRLRAKKAFVGCMRHYEAAVRLFGDNYTDILNAMQDDE